MSLTASEIGEGFFTMPTWITFLCNVTPSKSVTTTRVVEWFSTMLTHISLFLQCELFRGCSDDYARKTFFFHNACMYESSASCSVAPFVFVTPTEVVEGFATMLMHKVSLQCGSCYVCYNYWGGWRLSTMLTCIMTLCHVYPFMNVTSTGTSEWFSTTYMHKVSLQYEFFHECYKMQNW